MTSKERLVELMRKEFKLDDGVKFNLLECNGDHTRFSPYVFRGGKLFDKNDNICLYDEVVEIASYWENIEIVKEPLVGMDKEILKKQLELIPAYEPNNITIEFIKGNAGVYYQIKCATKHIPGSYDCMTSFEYIANFEHVEVYRNYTLEELGLED